MGKVKIVFLLPLISSFLFLMVHVDFGVKGSEHVIFEDDFEEYYVGAFPSQNWDLRFSGAGSTLQIIKNDVSVSSSNYLQLISDTFDRWSARASIPIPVEARFVGFEVRVMLPEPTGEYIQGARVGFSEYGTELIANWHAHVCLFNDGTIHAANGSPLGLYAVSNWTKIRVLFDRDLNIYSVWINDELKIENKVFPGDPYLFNYFSLDATYHTDNKAYFDDVKVFLEYDTNPKIELQPADGISQTTIQGSGYAPHSEITITWNGTKMFTVPNAVQTDSDGNFSAIVSVLNQTQMGPYPVTAIDELENQATATFNVIPEFPSWLLCPLLLVGTLLANAFKKNFNLTK